MRSQMFAALVPNTTPEEKSNPPYHSYNINASQGMPLDMKIRAPKRRSSPFMISVKHYC